MRSIRKLASSSGKKDIQAVLFYGFEKIRNKDKNIMGLNTFIEVVK